MSRLISKGTTAAFAIGEATHKTRGGCAHGLREAVEKHRANSAPLRVIPCPEQIDALGAVLSNLDEVLMTDNERADALIWAWEGMRAQGIEARQGGDVQQAPREAREPGPKDAPTPCSPSDNRSGNGW